MSAWDVQGTITGLSSLTWAGNWEPGWGGTTAGLTVGVPLKNLPEDFSFTGGMEIAGAALGSQILVPLGVLWRPSGIIGTPWTWGLGLKFLPGITLTRPRPLVLLGTEAEAGVRWTWENGWSVGLNLGIRYTTCPEYSAHVAEYSLWESPMGLTVGWSTP